MAKRMLTGKQIAAFAAYLHNEEKSQHTVEKYIRDVRALAQAVGGNALTKERVIAYKTALQNQGYAVSSINSMLASLNSLFAFLGWDDLKVKSLKRQRQVYCPEEKELTRAEYVRLVNAAKQRGNQRLYHILQTICGTGIRVSELPFITVEAVRRGEATVSLKGKSRTVFIPQDLQKELRRYIAEQQITAGSLFLTRTGKPIGRTTVWREMKQLCRLANVDPRKVFPHNLRHLFARVFYGLEKDMAKLADILGHSSINTTRLYIISTGAEHRRLMNRLRLII